MSTGTPIQNIERDLAGFRRLVLAVGAFVVALAAFYASELVVGRQSLTVRVLQVDVPRHCRETSGSGRRLYHYNCV